jgi:hypothetical protein
MPKLPIMKRQVATILLTGILFAAKAQTFEIGLRGGLDSFWLLNSNASPAGNSESKTISVSYNGGLHLAFDITDNIGLETNLMYASLSQSYSGNFNKTGVLPDGGVYMSGQSYTSKTTLTVTQIPIMMCFETNSGSFVELGVDYDMINGANYAGNFSNPSSDPSYSTASYFAKSNVAGVFGFGGKYSLNDYLFMLTDFRVTYGFTDIKGVDGLGQDYSNKAYYANYKPTTAINASINVGIFYLLPITPTYKVGHKCKGAPQVRGGTRHPK